MLPSVVEFGCLLPLMAVPFVYWLGHSKDWVEILVLVHIVIVVVLTGLAFVTTGSTDPGMFQRFIRYNSCFYSHMHVFSSFHNPPDRCFSGSDKRIWIEKSSFSSTKAALISSCQLSFTFEEITAFLFDYFKQKRCGLLFTRNSFQAGNQRLADDACSANQDQEVIPS